MSILHRLSPEDALRELTDGDLDQRVRAAERLAKAKDASVVEALTAALEDGESRVRDAVIMALEKVGEPAAASLRTAATKGHPIVQAGAAEALASIGDVNAIDILTRLLDSGELRVRKQAVRALGRYRIGNRLDDQQANMARTIAPLMKVLKDDDADLRACAEQSFITLRKTMHDEFLGKVFPLTVPYGETLTQLISAGHYERGGPRIYAFPAQLSAWELGPYPGEGEARPEMSLIRLGEKNERNIEKAQERLAERGLRAANVHELLAFAVTYPRPWLFSHICAIGSHTKDRRVPYVWCIPAAGFGLTDTQRFLEAAPFEDSWGACGGYRYLLAASGSPASSWHPFPLLDITCYSCKTPQKIPRSANAFECRECHLVIRFVACDKCRKTFQMGGSGTSVICPYCKGKIHLPTRFGTDAREQQYPFKWATDPFGRHESRYWDGRVWTEQVSDAGLVTTDTAG